MSNRWSEIACRLGLLFALILPGLAAAEPLTVTIQDDAFAPNHLTIEANKRVRIMVTNQSALPAEFEGTDFTAEKVIPGGTKLPVFVGPLKPGTYHFFNDFNSSVKGTLTVK